MLSPGLAISSVSKEKLLVEPLRKEGVHDRSSSAPCIILDEIWSTGDGGGNRRRENKDVEGDAVAKLKDPM